MLDMDDGGLASRKMWFSIGTSATIVLVAVLGAFWHAFTPCLDTVIGGLLGSLGIYAGANVTNKWLTGKNVANLAIGTSNSNTNPPYGIPLGQRSVEPVPPEGDEE